MVADHSENLHKLLESVSDDLQNLNLAVLRLVKEQHNGKLVEQLKEVVGPQVLTIREAIAAYERDKADVEKTVISISEWMKNVKKQFKEQLEEEIATSQPENLVAFEMYLKHEFFAEFEDTVNGLKPITEQPRRNGLGKDLITKFFTMQLELEVATQKKQNELDNVVKKVATMKDSVENMKKQLQELERMTEWVQNALPFR